MRRDTSPHLKSGVAFTVAGGSANEGDIWAIAL